MRKSLLPAVLLYAALGAGCSSIDRSRDVGDQRVPAHALAQQVCANCHGANGQSVSPQFPHLAGQQKEYLEKQLKSFRSHERQSPAGRAYMWGLSEKLTDEQIAGLAEYFAGRPAARGPVADPQLISSGKEIFEKGIATQNVPACAACHGSAGQGNHQFPRLAGQHADYIAKQLKIFRETDQRPGGAIMKPIAHPLTEQNISSIAAYLQSLPPM